MGVRYSCKKFFGAEIGNDEAWRRYWSRPDFDFVDPAYPRLEIYPFRDSRYFVFVKASLHRLEEDVVIELNGLDDYVHRGGAERMWYDEVVDFMQHYGFTYATCPGSLLIGHWR